MYQPITEQEWIYQYVKEKKENPGPLVLGTKGSWTANGKPIIILIGFTLIDVLTLAEIHHVSENPVRVMKHKDLTYFAVNIANKKRVKEIISEWNKVES